MRRDGMKSEEKTHIHLTEYLIQFGRFMVQKTKWSNWKDKRVVIHSTLQTTKEFND